MTTGVVQQESFFTVLASPGRSNEIPESVDVYGWLVGSWQMDVLHYKAADVSGLRMTGEIHFGWVLEGRAIQDVWIMPRRVDRTAALGKTNNTFGTTLRVWDPAVQAWHITWINPVTGQVDKQIGRRVGDEIVQLGARADGTATKWRFTEMTPDSFHWIGEALLPDGKTWRLEGEYRARRIAS
jgi:hypothetical protein